MNKIVEEKILLHQKFWKGELEHPMRGIFANFASEYNFPSIDLTLSSEEISLKNKLQIQNTKEEDDRMEFSFVNFGPAFLAALAGANFESDRNTSWAEPANFADLSELTISDFNSSHPLWVSYREKFLKVQEINSEWMMSLCDMTGPFDILAGVIGSERLCLEMIENSEQVKRLSDEATRFWFQVYDEHYSLLKEKRGTVDVFGLYMPGRGARWSEDFIALISPDMYEEFVLPCDIQIASRLDTSYIHLHSAALSSVDRILKNTNLKGVEISNDPNGPNLDTLIEAGKRVVEAGKSLMMSNWQRDLSSQDIEKILNSIPTHSLIVTYEYISKKY